MNIFKQIKFFNPVFLASFFFFLMALQASNAATVTQKIEALNLSASADYIKGDADKPAVLILHGFLTTNRFHTVVAMATGLNDNGHTVLSPTLSLGINHRKNSIKCNSIHTHTLENDVLEVKDWIDWLHQQGHQKIILLGHSSGSQELLEYLNRYQDNRIQAAIFTSLFYLNGKDLGILDNEIKQAESLVKQNINKPQKYNFLFCKNNYFATPESYLSYLKLDREYVLQSLTNLKVPSYSIMGGADKRYQSVGEDWLKELEATGTNLIVVEGANHFFSSEHEFDLQDQITEILNNY